ncbi:MAG: exosortase F system-associated membrane protein [Bacteroidota bacterium]
MNRLGRIGLFLAMGLVLVASYHYRDFSWIKLITSGQAVAATDPALSSSAILNKVLRYLVNDMAALGIIYALFAKPSYVRLGWWIMWFGLGFLLPLYYMGLWLLPPSLHIALSYLHRLVMNPVLLMLLIPALYYQNSLVSKTKS